MPKLKQPSPLLKMATDRLVDSLAQRCNDCSMNGSLEELRQVVAFIKADIGPKIPWHIEADFFESFLSRYWYVFRPREERPESHKRAVLEVIMDRKIVGLSVSSDLAKSMDLEDAHRLRGLITLDLHGSRRYNLEMFHLQDLTKFICDDQCTDADLLLIGKNCPKLDYLSIKRSKQVTDKGLDALNSCTELRIVEVRGCWNITNRCIKNLLSAHEKIQKIDFDFQFFSDEGWSVYPSITHYEVDLENMTYSNLRLIGKKFPNLTSLRLFGELDDFACLNTLGSLKKLTDLHFESEGDVFVWDALKPLLRSIGANITKLHTSSSGDGVIGTFVAQADLDFLHEFCPNIETLAFDYDAEEDGQMFVIPPFRRLRKLECINPSEYPDYARWQFGVMANLETLHIENVEMTTETLESMVLDNDKFPVLNHLKIVEASSDCDLNRIRKIVKNNNIDLHLNVT